MYEIRPPIRIQFDAVKSTAGFGLNKLKCKVYGLAKEKRGILTKDFEQQKVVNIRLSVGYGTDLKMIFSGQLQRGANQLTNEGYVSDFECFDGGVDYFTAVTSTTVLGKNNAINSVISNMPNTSKGKITGQPDLVRPRVLVGVCSKLLEDLTSDEEQFFVDNGAVNITKQDEVISNQIPEVNESTGLIDTPTKDASKITFTSVLNPFIVIGGRVNLESAVDTRLNGVIRIETIGYKGDFEGNDWRQECTGFPAQGATVL